MKDKDSFLFCYSILFRLWPFHMRALSSWQLECFEGKQRESIGLESSVVATYQLCLLWVSSSILKYIPYIIIILCVNDSEWIGYHFYADDSEIYITFDCLSCDSFLQLLSTVFEECSLVGRPINSSLTDQKLNFY